MTKRAESNSAGREVTYYASFEIIRDGARTGRFTRSDEVATTQYDRIDPSELLKESDPGTVPFVKYSAPYELFDVNDLMDPKIAAAALAGPVAAPRPRAVGTTPPVIAAAARARAIGTTPPPVAASRELATGTPPAGAPVVANDGAPVVADDTRALLANAMATLAANEVAPIDATQPFASSSVDDMLAVALVETTNDGPPNIIVDLDGATNVSSSIDIATAHLEVSADSSVDDDMFAVAPNAATASSSIDDMLATALVETHASSDDVVALTPPSSSIDDMLALALVETSASAVIDTPEPPASASIDCDLRDLAVECELGEPLASDTGELHEDDLMPLAGANDTLTMTVDDHETFANNPPPMRNHARERHALPTLSVSFENSAPVWRAVDVDDAAAELFGGRTLDTTTDDAAAEVFGGRTLDTNTMQLFGARHPTDIVDAPPVARNLVALAQDLDALRSARHETELVDAKPGISVRFVVVATLLLAAAFALGLGIPYLVLS